MPNKPMVVGDLMSTEVLTVLETDCVDDVLEVLVAKRLHGVPVVDSEGALIGMLSQQDVFFGGATRGRSGADGVRVGEIMTSPAVTTTEGADLRELCATMADLRLHRVPVIRDDKVVGIVSSLDICRALADGRLDD